MIGRLCGTLVWKRAPTLLLDVQGVGYEVDAPMTTFYALPEAGKEITLQIHMVVREDAQLLYAFATEAERSLFRFLLKINGVGAKLALTILSGMSADAFAQCIRDNDVATLVRLPGVGKKTAERLIIEMRDRLDKEACFSSPDAPVVVGSVLPTLKPSSEAVSALVALGYKPQEASRMVHAVDDAALSSEELIRQALKASVKA